MIIIIIYAMNYKLSYTCDEIMIFCHLSFYLKKLMHGVVTRIYLGSR